MRFVQIQSAETFQREVGRRVRERRKALGLSQAELARRTDLGLDASAISRIESGGRSLQLFEASAIAEVLGSDLASIAVFDSETPVRTVVEDALEAARKLEEAKVTLVLAEEQLVFALQIEGEAFQKVHSLLAEFATLDAEMQAWVIRKLAVFSRDRGGAGKAAYDAAVSAAAPESIDLLSLESPAGD